MKAFAIFAALATALPMAAHALGPVQIQEKIVIKTEQFKGVRYLLEQRLGRELTAKEKSELSEEMVPGGPIDTDPDKLIIKISDGGPRDASKSLWCVGAGYNVTVQVFRAVCASLDTGRSYDLGFAGVSYGMELKTSVFHLTFSYDSSRYANTFDPIPGNYFLISQSVTVGLGVTGFVADAGNKSVTGKGLNFGGGGELFGASALLIQ